MSWVSNTVDYRPLTYPPRKEILGWWCTGYNEDDMPTIVALVQCNDLNDVAEIIYSEWPESRQFVEQFGWRFADLHVDDFVPGDRFVLTDWMRERLDTRMTESQ